MHAHAYRRVSGRGDKSRTPSVVKRELRESGEKDVRGGAADIIMINYNILRAPNARLRRQVVRAL